MTPGKHKTAIAFACALLAISLSGSSTVMAQAQRADELGNPQTSGPFSLRTLPLQNICTPWILSPVVGGFNAALESTTLQNPAQMIGQNAICQQAAKNGVEIDRSSGASFLRQQLFPTVSDRPSTAGTNHQSNPQSQGEAVDHHFFATPTSEGTRLIVAEQIATQSGMETPIAIRLTTTSGRAIPNQSLILFADNAIDLHRRTDSQGLAVFSLPPNLTQGAHNLRIVYPGDKGLRGAIADLTIRFQPNAPTKPLAHSKSTMARTGASVVPDLLYVLSMTIQAVHVRLAAFSEPLWASVTGFAASAWQAVSTWSNLMQTKLAPLLAVLLPPLAAMAQIGYYAIYRREVQVAAIAILLGLNLAPVLNWRRWQNPLPLAVGRGLAPASAGFSLPMPVWYTIRIVSVGVALGVAIILFARPQMGLFIFWQLLIPLLPLLFFIAPGLWRNICPMAALNQMPRLLGFTRALNTPKWMQKYGYLIAISLFLILVSSRKIIFNQNGAALGVLILVSLFSALVAGTFFRGKSGWCSSICPLLPVQRIYGQTPFATVTHAHCQPCLACTKNCYDLSPANAYLADLYDDDRHFALFRKAFVGLFPGFVLAFYLVPNQAQIPNWEIYALLAGAAVASMGTFFLVGELTKVTSSRITVFYGAAALNLYYWFNSVTLGSLLATTPPLWFVWSLRSVVFGLTLFWIYRTVRKENEYIELNVAPARVHIELSTLPAGQAVMDAPVQAASPEVTIEPSGQRFAVAHNRTLLEAVEQHDLPIESGCRMGLCGADPVCIMAGMENLSKIGADERTTLERLALAPTTRLACMARVRGPVTVALAPEKPNIYQSSIVAGFRHDTSIKRVVIIGNGIAGVTAADHIRRRHPTCEIHLIGREPHHLYNRMGITRLIYGRSAMQGLYLLPDQWYDDFGITCWLNTHVETIDTQSHQVHLATGEALNYDRLILTTGSQSFVPPIAGFGIAGTFVLRSAEDAMSIRAFVQEHKCKKAIVAGGGLLGLEAAYALHKLGLGVTVLERSKSLLSRQLDSRGSEYLHAYLEQLGISVMMESEVEAVDHQGEGATRPLQVTLKTGQALTSDLLLVAAGILADIELANQAGLATKRGVLVDPAMRTSDPAIFAAGDVVEFDGKIQGLWPVAVSQAEVAAANAVAEPGMDAASFSESPAVTMLKVAGIDVMSIGRIQPHSEGELIIALEEREANRYRKLIIEEGKIVGAILLGYPEEAPGITEAVKQELDVRPYVEALQAGNWHVLPSFA